MWTSVAHRADWAICLARTNPDAPKHKGITYFLVDMKSAGIDVRPLREITGEAMFNEVFLDDVFVPDELVVGEVDGGWTLARATLANERVAMGHGSSIGEDVERLLAACRRQRRRRRCRNGSARLVAEGSGLLAARPARDAAPARRARSRRRVERAQARRRAASAERRRARARTCSGRTASLRRRSCDEFLMTRCLTIAGGTTQVLLTVAAERILGLPRGYAGMPASAVAFVHSRNRSTPRTTCALRMDGKMSNACCAPRISA